MDISKILSLVEARKNPELNPKVSPYQRIKERYAKDGDNLYVSFTAIDKLGINPQSQYDTPLGIYAYPAKYILETVSPKSEDLDELPFAGNSPYVNIFNGAVNIIDISKITQPEMMKYLNILQKYYPKSNIKELLELSTDNARRPRYPGGRLWYILHSLIVKVDGTDYDFNTNPEYDLFNLKKSKKMTRMAKSHAVKWNSMLRTMGIYGIIDSVGIIHDKEPTQALFLTKSSIKNVERLNNTQTTQTINSKKILLDILKDPNDYPSYQLSSENFHKYKHAFKDPKVQMAVLDKIIRANRVYDIHGFLLNLKYNNIPQSEELQMAVLQHPLLKTDLESYIKSIKDPTQNVINYVKHKYPNLADKFV